jgi:hypothetical protein
VNHSEEEEEEEAIEVLVEMLDPTLAILEAKVEHKLQKVALEIK